MNKSMIADRWNDNIIERDYLRKINLRDAQAWFRFRSRMTTRIETNIDKQT